MIRKIYVFFYIFNINKLFVFLQKKPKFALDQINGLEKGQQMTFLIQNLKCIVHCELNEVGDAFKIIQSLMNKNDRAKLFPETVRFRIGYFDTKIR